MSGGRAPKAAAHSVRAALDWQAMSAADDIRQALARVAALRAAAEADRSFAEAVAAVKRFQALRFAGSYCDLLAGPIYAAPARFFLRELYGPHDFRARDDQFARIAGTLARVFPARVVDTSRALAHLHALSETLDFDLARLWASHGQTSDAAIRYIRCWRSLGRRRQRFEQLRAVIAIGQELVALTRRRGLHAMLRMMRGPAAAAGLHSLQRFLESGFDTFAAMSRQPGLAEGFLSVVDSRESQLIDSLFDQPEPMAAQLLRDLLRMADPAHVDPGT